MEKYDRFIYKKKNFIKYSPRVNIEDNVDKLRVKNDQKFKKLYNNCHWGQIKLFVSELEFLLRCSKYVDINECLVLYVGAADGYRLKHLFIKYFFPKINMLLYDPQPFHIEQSSQIIIKTGRDGYFTDEKIDEVLKIAKGRKILYLSDIRLSDDDFDIREVLIYGNMLEQQRWGVLMGAEFMLLKFRMFFYEKDYKEINFLDNSYITSDEIKDKFIYPKDDKKYTDNTLWMLYLDGAILSQIYAPIASTETRLFVKKIKYYKDNNKYSSDEQEKYKMKYYNNLEYEGILNGYNINIRNNEYFYKNSDLFSKYVPTYTNTYENITEFYIYTQYLMYNKQQVTLTNILNLAYNTYIFLNSNYTNSFILCPLKKFHKFDNTEKRAAIFLYLYFKKDLIQKQFNNIKSIKSIDEDIIKKLINSYDINKKVTDNIFEIKDGVVTQFQKTKESVDKITEIVRNYIMYVLTR